MTTDTTLTIEPEGYGYGQHIITVEREGLAAGGCVILTDAELSALAPLIAQYQAAREVFPSAISVTFADQSGRTDEQQREAAEGARP
jgi:hypothetical protein